MTHPRWERVEGDRAYFRDEDSLIARFWLLAAGGILLMGGLGTGVWRLRAATLQLPSIIGVAGGRIFRAPAQGLDTLRETDFDQPFADTVQVLFRRTEKGGVPALRDFCAPEVIAAVERDYREAAARYPAGFVQSLTLLESKRLEARAGLRRWFYRGLLSSRSQAASQVSPVYLEATFAIVTRSAANPAGWQLVRLKARTRDDFYRDEEASDRRRALGLAP